MTMRVSHLRERITLIHVRRRQTTTGELQEVAKDIGQVWAKIVPLSAKEEDWAEARCQRYRVVIRSRAEHFQHIRWRQKVYSLTAQPIWDLKRLWLEFIIVEKLS